MDDKLISWIVTELEHQGWSYRELGRRAELSQTAVSNVISGHRKAGPEFCVKVARAFGVPPEKVLRLADILPPITAADDPQIIEATELLRNMPSDKRDFAMKLLRLIYRDQDKP